ncbi:MAG TPA: epimerase [Sulfurimonas sp. UBA12504]|nr:MAG: epimerase [Sulfurimonas sp. GWF2_37_8]DAB31002.1 MAG TPA: epimerase [Sulfurimonas sp. UBA12504]
MKILLTGSSGYVGKNFVMQYKNKYEFVQFSLQINTLESINFEGIETILHCAALVHQKIEYSYEKYYEINAEYPLRLAKAAKACGVKQFVFMSSIAVYGEGYSLLKEDTPCNPTTFYGKSKLKAEQELQKLEDEKFIVCIVRAPMVYGKEAPGNIAALINLVKKMSLLPFGQITNKRSFVYIKNLCQLIDVLVEKKKSGIFLASDDKPLSTTRLIELITQNLEKKVTLIKVPLFETLLKYIKPSLHKKLYENLEIDNSFTKDILNFKNRYMPEEGMHEMIQGEIE